VQLVIATDALVQGRFDRALFQRAVSNLLTNALAHTPRGGQIELFARRGDRHITVRVSDTGCGIEAADLPRLFERFHRSQRTQTTGRAMGLGLGLAIVKRIMQLHGGTIEVASTVGRGTAVTLQWPAQDASVQRT
jgi:signal transduction histidine kinase